MISRGRGGAPHGTPDTDACQMRHVLEVLHFVDAGEVGVRGRKVLYLMIRRFVGAVGGGAAAVVNVNTLPLPPTCTENVALETDTSGPRCRLVDEVVW